MLGRYKLHFCHLDVTVEVFLCDFSFFLWVFVRSERVSVDMTEIVLREMTLANQLNFIPECRKYIGLGSQGTNSNLY